MNDVHPSSSASHGRSILKSDFIKRTDPAEHYIECAQCGFPVNLDRAAQGDAVESDNTSQESGVHQTARAVVGLATAVDQLPQALRSSSARYIGTFNHVEPVVNSGCPNCGSLNSRGVGRNSDPFMTNVRDFRNAW